MKEINLKISDEIFSSLSSFLAVKSMTGNLYGIADEFLLRVVKAVKEGKTDFTLMTKEEWKKEELKLSKEKDSKN